MGYLTAVQESGGGLRLVGPDETVVSKDYCKHAQDNLTTIWDLRREVASEREQRQVAERKAKTYQERHAERSAAYDTAREALNNTQERLREVRTAYNTESERSTNWARECGKAREAHRRAETAAENLKAENADLKDLLKQVMEYAILSSGSHGKIRPEDGVRSLAFKLGDAPHLNIEIEDGVIVKDRKRIKVWAPAPPNPDEPILKAINSEYPSTAAPVLLQRLRRAGLDITLKDQSKGETLAAWPSLKSVS